MKMLTGVLVVTLLAACSATQPARVATAPSGFLKDYSLLVSDPHDADYRYYRAPDIQSGQYRSFLIDTPVFLVNTGQAYSLLDPVRLRDIADYYQQRMASLLRTKGYQLATEPGPGVARLRVAIVGLVEASPAFKVRDLVPVKVLFEVARSVADKSPYVLRMSMEGEVLDSATGRLLGAAVDSRESGKTVSGSQTPPSADQVHQLVDFWVERFSRQLGTATTH